MSAAEKKLPKLSYVLLSHNRERYIRQAIESAFAQDYEGELEYIFSDDCSTDRTYEIIKDCVAAYKGNRKVVVTQTPHNMHLAGHTNYAVQFATGDFVIRADDDDLSTVDRCSVIGKAIAEHPGCSCVIARISEFVDADEEAVIARCKKRTMEVPEPVVLDVATGFDGISEFFAPNRSNKAWHIGIYRLFPQLPDDAYWVDDLICMHRANALGECISLPAVVVMARKECLNMSNGGGDGQRGFAAIMRLEQFNDKYWNTTYAPLKKTAIDVREYMQKNRPQAFAAAGKYFDVLDKDLKERAIWQSYWRKGTLNRLRIRRQTGNSGLFSLMRCLPMPIFATLQAIWRGLVKRK